MSLTNPKYFIEREYIQRNIFSSLQAINGSGRGENVLIYGETGIGKTALLRYAQSFADPFGFLAVYMRPAYFEQTGNVSDFFAELAYEVARTAAEVCGLPSHVIGDLFDRLQSIYLEINLVFLTVGAAANPQREKPQYHRSGNQIFDDLFKLIAQNCSVKGILLLLDDGDGIPLPALNMMRDVFPEHGKYTVFLVTGDSPFISQDVLVVNPDAEDNINPNHPRFRMARTFRKQFEIVRMSQQEIASLIREPLNQYAKQPGCRLHTIDDLFVKTIYELTKGNPSLALDFASAAFARGCQPDGRIILTQEVITDVISSSARRHFLTHNLLALGDGLRDIPVR